MRVENIDGRGRQQSHKKARRIIIPWTPCTAFEESERTRSIVGPGIPCR